MISKRKKKAKTESCFRVDKNLSLYTGKKNIRLLFLKCGFGCYVMAKQRISHAASTQDGTLSLSLIIIHNVHKTKYAIIPVL